MSSCPSLTSQVNDPRSPIGGFLRERLPNVAALRPAWRDQLREVATIRPGEDLRGHWGTLGSAIDYRLRFYFPQPPGGRLVAHHGALALHLRTDLKPALRSHWWKLSREFFVRNAERVADIQPGTRLGREAEDDLCRHSVVLALFDQLYRAGPAIHSPLYELPASATVADLLALAPAVWVDDLRAMSWAFFGGFAELLSQPAVLNPTFAGSCDVHADGDLIVGDCLIEIKALTDANTLRTRHVHELVGYTLLDYRDEYRIRSAGFYLARQAKLIRWPLQELLATLAGGPVKLSALRREFESLLSGEEPARR